MVEDGTAKVLWELKEIHPIIWFIYMEWVLTQPPCALKGTDDMDHLPLHAIVMVNGIQDFHPARKVSN